MPMTPKRGGPQTTVANATRTNRRTAYRAGSSDVGPVKRAFGRLGEDCEAHFVEPAWYSFLPQVLVALASAAALGTSLWKDRHPLASIERLSQLADHMSPGTTRDAFTDYRDQRANLWLLEQRAPREGFLLGLGRWLVATSSIALLAWLLLAIMAPTSPQTWIAYVVGLVLIFTSTVVFQRRRKHRRAWIEQEAQWRQLPLPTEASRPSTST